jgi:hypothetical protein
MRYTNCFAVRLTGGTFLFLLIVALGQNARAQDTGSIGGTVTEESCDRGVRGVAGVIVVVDDLGLVAQTDDHGFYAFDDVPPGPYTMSFFQLGDRWAPDEYFGQARRPVTVVAGGTATVNVLLPFEAPGQIFVGLVDGTTIDDARALADAYGLRLLQYFGFGALYLVPEWAFLDDYFPLLQQDPLVRYAEPNSYVCID